MMAMGSQRADTPMRPWANNCYQALRTEYGVHGGSLSSRLPRPMTDRERRTGGHRSHWQPAPEQERPHARYGGQSRQGPGHYTARGVPWPGSTLCWRTYYLGWRLLVPELVQVPPTRLRAWVFIIIQQWDFMDNFCYYTPYSVLRTRYCKQLAISNPQYSVLCQE